MIDASKGFRKDGPKNRLREQDIHRIVDVFTKQADVSSLRPAWCRWTEISRPEERLQPQPAALHRQHRARGSGRTSTATCAAASRSVIWTRSARTGRCSPACAACSSSPRDRPGYARLKSPLVAVKPAILGHAEFAAFQQKSTKGFADWRKVTTPRLTSFDKDGHPKALSETIAEDLLAAFRQSPLLDAYDVYQHLMDYWAETMQDDAYLISAAGWVTGAQPREIVQVKNKDKKLVWPESHDYLKGKRRFKSDLVPASILVARYFVAERDALEAFDNQFATLEQQLDEMRQENSGEDGLLAEVIEGEGDKQKIARQRP